VSNCIGQLWTALDSHGRWNPHPPGASRPCRQRESLVLRMQSHYSDLARREDFTANSRSWFDHAVSLDLEGREIGGASSSLAPRQASEASGKGRRL
jgi:hypothetical protein